MASNAGLFYNFADDFENDFGPPSKKSKLKSRDVKYENRKHGNEKCRPKERYWICTCIYLINFMLLPVQAHLTNQWRQCV